MTGLNQTNILIYAYDIHNSSVLHMVKIHVLTLEFIGYLFFDLKVPYSVWRYDPGAHIDWWKSEPKKTFPAFEEARKTKIMPLP